MSVGVSGQSSGERVFKHTVSLFSPPALCYVSHSLLANKRGAEGNLSRKERQVNNGKRLMFKRFTGKTSSVQYVRGRTR